MLGKTYGLKNHLKVEIDTRWKTPVEISRPPQTHTSWKWPEIVLQKSMAKT